MATATAPIHTPPTAVVVATPAIAPEAGKETAVNAARVASNPEMRARFDETVRSIPAHYSFWAAVVGICFVMWLVVTAATFYVTVTLSTSVQGTYH